MAIGTAGLTEEQATQTKLARLPFEQARANSLHAAASEENQVER
jgi:hypothetical protein